MYLTLFTGFTLGFLLPLMASRFGKFMPADAGTALASLFHRPRFSKGLTLAYKMHFKNLWMKLLGSCVLFGLILMSLYGMTDLYFSETSRIFIKIMIFLSLLLALVDAKLMLLPDVLTMPLLIFGFAYSVFGGAISPETSVLGALFGYFLPTVAVFLIYPLIKGGFGGGDVKMLAALGAWLGFVGLNLTLLLSCVVFMIFTLFTKEKSGPYGPALAISALIVLFVLTLNFEWLRPFLRIIQ